MSGQNLKSTRNFKVFCLLLLVALVVLAGRLGWIQLVDGKLWAERARERGLPENLSQPTLFAPATVPSVTKNGEAPAAWMPDEGPRPADWVDALAALDDD